MLVAAALVVAVLAGAGAASGASDSSVVGATVASATNLDATTGCATGTAGVTHFGSVTTGSTNVTTADCIITFGSSNDTASLRVAQADGGGVAMWTPDVGTLDTSFATDGSANAVTANATWAMDIGEDGTAYTVSRDFEILAHRPDGTPEAAFGGGVVDLPGTYARALTAAPGGGLYAGGELSGSILIHQLRADGTPDPTLDGDGSYARNLQAGGGDAVRDLIVLDDGSLVWVAESSPGAGNFDVAVGRLSAAGVPDPDWGGGTGWILIDTSDVGGIYPSAAVDPQGRIIVTVGTASTIKAWRLDPDTGAIDGGWGTAGEAVVDIAGVTEGSRSVIVDRDGTTYIVGESNNGGDMAGVVAALDGTGGPVASFGAGGVFSWNPDAGQQVFRDVLLDPDGDGVYLVGRADSGGAELMQVAVVHVDGAGQLDSTVLDGGVLLHDEGSGTNDEVSEDDIAAWDTDGRMVVAINWGASSDLALTRFDSIRVDDYVDTVTDWNTGGTNLFGACLDSVDAATTTATWVEDPDTCTADDLDPWNAVPTTPVEVARTNASAETAGVARLRFGLRTLASQQAGSYVAPITFDVVAPAP